ncbi:MAG: SDR family NAD(P)-dependent oxidoreductase, partial [Propionibacteriaceae bacterium]|nr:SDR family NAD(P)-dependent oxidoreductase [Propionibacteriaceae bacterium]
LVTGGARGIGRAFALRLALLGADVGVLDRDLRSFEASEAEATGAGGHTTGEAVRAQGRRAHEVGVDVTDTEALHAAVEEVAATLGGLDILVCNAGGGSGSMADSRASAATPEHVRTVVDLNLVATVATCRAAVPHLRGKGWGRIVTLSSQAGRRVYPDGGYSIYGAAKAGVALYTRALAQELGPEGITANCLAPGYIETGRLAPLFTALSGADDLRERIALRRYGTPDDVAGVLEFLVTDLGAYVTGASIAVDGGSTD